MNNTISLKQLCQQLHISINTGKNWIKSGKLIPTSTEKGIWFSTSYVNFFLQQLKEQEYAPLKNRRNKTHISGMEIYYGYTTHQDNIPLLESITTNPKQTLTKRQCCLLLANFALQSFAKTGGNLIALFYKKEFSIGIYDCLIQDLISDFCYEDELQFLEPILQKQFFHFYGDDQLGLAYLSLRNMGNRKSFGAYFTPNAVVSSMVAALSSTCSILEKTCFDPCCGSGNFLLYLAMQGTSLENLYGTDIDPISVMLTRINMALFYAPKCLDLLYHNFNCSDTLHITQTNYFDIILGNPPWGCDFSSEEYAYHKSCFQCAVSKHPESYDIFLEKSFDLLRPNGYLAFVLPEAILTVKSHKPIRDFLAERVSFHFVSYIGNVFSGVQCPAILLGIEKSTKTGTIGCLVCSENKQFFIQHPRDLSMDSWCFSVCDGEYEILDYLNHLPNSTTLKDHADFALGIVTGDNKRLLTKELLDGYEPILKGSNIQKYQILPPSYFIKFEPDQFQQVAPTKYYRAKEKLLYRFISDTLMFTYDDNQLLSLNSCNIVIPHIEGLHVKYILAILNSHIAQFYVKRTYHSVKVLRSHIESIPIPVVSKEIQEEIVLLVDILLKNEADFSTTTEILENKIASLYGLLGNIYVLF